MATPLGFEPRITPPKGAVLPLHHGVIWRILDNYAQMCHCVHMRQTKLKLAATHVNGKRFWQVTTPKLGGGRNRRTFKDREEAKAYCDLAKAKIQDFGNAAMSISDALRGEAVKCSQELQLFGKTITDATRFYVDHLTEITRRHTVSHVANALQAACKADGKSVRYLRDLKYRLGRFATDFGSRHIAEISTADI